MTLVYISVYGIDKQINPIGAIIGRNAEKLYKVQDFLNGMKVRIIKYDESDLILSVREAFGVSDGDKEYSRIKNVYLDSKSRKIKIFVSSEECVAMLVGHKGERVTRASALVRKNIDVRVERESA
ncbi:hypothetical protein KKA87_12475 [bacterium]|nr:hypothetical protein [bacterium]